MRQITRLFSQLHDDKPSLYVGHLEHVGAYLSANSRPLISAKEEGGGEPYFGTGDSFSFAGCFRAEWFQERPSLSAAFVALAGRPPGRLTVSNRHNDGANLSARHNIVWPAASFSSDERELSSKRRWRPFGVRVVAGPIEIGRHLDRISLEPSREAGLN